MHHTFLKYPKRKEYSLHHTYCLIFIFYNTEIIWRKSTPTWVAAEVDNDVEFTSVWIPFRKNEKLL